MFQGNEVEKTYDGGAGKVVVDIDAHGSVKVANSYEKKFGESLKVKVAADIEVSIFDLAAQAAKKTGTEWDDKAIAGLKSLLGLVDPAPAPEPAPAA